jgi:hypothetical protein
MVILLLDIGGYSIIGYWWLFYYWILVVILLVVLVIILLMVISDYSIIGINDHSING